MQCFGRKQCFGRTTSCQCRCATMISFRCSLFWHILGKESHASITASNYKVYKTLELGSSWRLHLQCRSRRSTSSCNLLGAQPNARTCHISLVKTSHAPESSDVGRVLTGCPGPRSVSVVSKPGPSLFSWIWLFSVCETPGSFLCWSCHVRPSEPPLPGRGSVAVCLGVNVGVRKGCTIVVQCWGFA